MRAAVAARLSWGSEQREPLGRAAVAVPDPQPRPVAGGTDGGVEAAAQGAQRAAGEVEPVLGDGEGLAVPQLHGGPVHAEVVAGHVDALAAGAGDRAAAGDGELLGRRAV